MESDMRYSIIHHDVREKFSLTISEYLVADSIHQLSYRKPYSKPLTIVGAFLGFADKTIWRARDALQSKSLIEYSDGGWRATDLWVDEVTRAKTPDKLSTQTGQNAPTTGQNVQHTISKEYKEYVISADAQSEPRKEKKDTGYVKVFELWGKYPANWKMNRTQIQAAKNLLEEHSLAGIVLALEFADKHVDDPYCPTITSPYDLDTKWVKLLAYKNKLRV